MSTTDRVSRLRNPDPADLRHAATIPGMIWLPVMACAGPMLADALEIADSCARSDIESFCIWNEEGGVRWFDTLAVNDACGPEANPMIAQAVRYLEARGMLTRDEKQPHLVRIGECAA